MNILHKALLCLVTASVLISCSSGGDKSGSGPYTPPADVPVSSVSVSPSSLELLIGGIVQLSSTVSPSNATDKSVTWSSSNQTVATVSPTGLVSAKAKGSATITVDASGKTANCNLTVSIPVSSVTLNKTELSLKEGTSETLTATVSPDDAADKTVIWTSSNASVSTVDNTGKVTAIAPGSVKITASCGGKSAVCIVTVTKKGGLSDRPDEEI
ncbi:MAG: Ig domain-containing protein [Bacteroidales bacterium]|nr:Ig domain-containing protein [Bacteroidales bacterium]